MTERSVGKVGGGHLGELLVREGVITTEQLQQALGELEEKGGRLSVHLISLGFITEKQLVGFLAHQYNVLPVNLSEATIDSEVIKLVPRKVCEKHSVIPVDIAGSALIVAMCDPSNIFAIDDIKFLTGYNVEVVVAKESDIRAAIEKHYGPLPVTVVLINVINGRQKTHTFRLTAPGDSVQLIVGGTLTGSTRGRKEATSEEDQQDLAPQELPLPTFEEVMSDIDDRLF